MERLLLCLPKAPDWSNTKLSSQQLGRQREQIGGEKRRERERQGDAWGQPGRQLPSQESRTHRMKENKKP